MSNGTADSSANAQRGKSDASQKLTAATAAISAASNYADKLKALREFTRAHEAKIQQDRRAAVFGL